MSHGLLSKCIIILVVGSMVLGANTRINNISAINGVFNILSPTNIVVGRPGPDYSITKIIEFGTYAQVNDESDPTNILLYRTTGTITLHHVGNEQGSYYCMSFTTGE